MRSTMAIVEVARRELWPAAVITAVLGLLSMGLMWLIVPDDLIRQWGAAADGPMLLSALWGGSVITAGSTEEQVFTLARPMSRMRWLAVHMAVLLVAVAVVGVAVDLFSGSLGVGQPLPSGYIALELIYASICGLLGGSLIQGRATAFGMAFVMSILCIMAPQIAAEALRNVLETSSRMPLRITGLTVVVVLAGCLAAGLPVVVHWLRWMPLRTPRAQQSAYLLLAANLAVVTAVWWLIGPELVRS